MIEPAKVECECEPDPSAVRRARELVAAALASWDRDDVVEVAELLTSELVSNAVVHARTAFTVSVQADPPVARIEVHDRLPSLPMPEAAPADESEHGRGLLLVEALASQWGARVAEGGKVVWFVLRSALQDAVEGSSPAL